MASCWTCGSELPPAALAAATSRPQAMQDGSGAQLEQALAFFRGVRATRYLHEGERLLSLTS